ncbi:hypothetical protein [Fredinandcohnia onubensis]|uniref:hypothetical protein n=1 Tax=Fredinandcohnia onubensis TaxID=1571209 RepID=UPI000C0BE90C|nr:hypothetical protein [Fredinandcohnia onubensis]
MGQREWGISRGESEKSADCDKGSGKSAEGSRNAVLIATKGVEISGGESECSADCDKGSGKSVEESQNAVLIATKGVGNQ